MAQEKQKTIAKEVIFTGKALQTGKRVEMVCKPAEADEGITFKRTDLPGEGPIRLEEAMLSDGGKRRSTIGVGAVQVQTVEHFLAALWGLGIDNLIVELSGAELPAMDGSALGFLAQLKETGTTLQEEERRTIRIDEPISVGSGERTLSVVPAETFSVSYFIDYKIACIGQEKFDFSPTEDSFEYEIAPARTFCMLKEALLLRIAGLGRGATLDNTLVLAKKGPVGTRLRFSNEPVRHKVLDLVGDLYMLGRPIVGKITAQRSGHNLNGELVKIIAEKYT